MALYTVSNLTKGTVVLPPPLGKRLDKYETVRLSAPAGLTEPNFNRKYSALVRMIQTGLISVVTVEDTRIDDNVEVATVSMIKQFGSQYMAVADIVARDTIPTDQRSEGMLVRTNDTGQFWVLEADLTTWTQVFTSTSAVRTQIPLLGILDGTNRTFTLPDPFVNVLGGQSLDLFHNGRRLIRTDNGSPAFGDYLVIGSGGVGTGVTFVSFAPQPYRSQLRANYVVP